MFDPLEGNKGHNANVKEKFCLILIQGSFPVRKLYDLSSSR